MKDVRNVTIRQLIIACGVSRKLPIKEIIHIADCTRVYYYKCINRNNFPELVSLFDALPLDKDTSEYKGLSTVIMEIARLLYIIGEKDAKS